ncbi:LutC/YkgG family protein [Pseudalkalibacillus hwajinpoensis]|uniref:LutC/YkgG family protein n=1 Tax=Guptibacillus hwajinpoensis TaxID=208199 RepID=UPI001CFF4CA8|nr:lactate utilization protein C [Pseudalkalibacillus hwajinpoensis]
MVGHGSVKNREDFLKKLSGKLGRNKIENEVKVPKWELRPQYQILQYATQDDLVHVFKKAAEKINTNVVETTLQDLPLALKEEIGVGVPSIISWSDPRFEEYKLNTVLNDYHHHTWDTDTGKKNIVAARDADIGITFSDYTLAESATVVLTTSAEKGRSVSLLPKTYIALVPKSTIVPRLTQVTDKIEKNLENQQPVSSCIKFISGPSNSADIELSFVEGVHGPVKASYIVISDC